MFSSIFRYVAVFLGTFTTMFTHIFRYVAVFLLVYYVFCSVFTSMFRHFAIFLGIFGLYLTLGYGGSISSENIRLGFIFGLLTAIAYSALTQTMTAQGVWPSQRSVTTIDDSLISHLPSNRASSCLNSRGYYHHCWCRQF